MTSSEEFETNHLDRVTCLDINHDGSMILTGSIDHRIKIWAIAPHTQERTLVETFTAHDADIRDAKWLHPSTGTYLGSVGNDLRFQLTGEDVTQAPNSGRRFRKVCSISSPTKVPFVSLDFRNIDNVYTYLALIDRQGLLSIYEPTNPDDFKEWTLIDRLSVVVPIPGRGEQTCFKVRWDQNPLPLPYVCGINNERRQLSLVVTAGNEVKVYRGINMEETTNRGNGPSYPGFNDGEASHRINFYEAFKLPSHPSLIRDVQWAPFNIRGTDLFATACKDGGVRIFEVSISEPFDSHHYQSSEGSAGGGGAGISQDGMGGGGNNSLGSSNHTTPSKSPYVGKPHLSQQQPQSSTLTSAITGGRQQATTFASQQYNPSSVTSPNTSAANRYATSRAYEFPYNHTVSLIANLEHAHEDAWSVSWDPNGTVLISGGTDGSTKIWRRSVLEVNMPSGGDGNGNGEDSGLSGALGPSENGGGKWMLFADQVVTFNDENQASDRDE